MLPEVHDQLRQLTAEEDDTLLAARSRAGAVVLPAPEIGALLAWVVRVTAARSVVELGAAAGVTGRWLARDLPDRGVLTCVEPDPHLHALAEAALAPLADRVRVRAILAEPTTVLPRLAEGAYDVVLLQLTGRELGPLADHARRLLRPGGWLVVRRALADGPTLVEALTADPGFQVTVLSVDDGLVLAVRSHDDTDPDTDPVG